MSDNKKEKTEKPTVEETVSVFKPFKKSVSELEKPEKEKPKTTRFKKIEEEESK